MVALTFFYCIIHRHLRLEAELNAMQWKIKWDDILQGNQDIVGTGRRLSIATLGRHSIAVRFCCCFFSIYQVLYLIHH